MTTRAAAAGVTVPSDEPAPIASPTAPTSMDLRTALELAARHNRRIAEGEIELASAAERVWDSRGRLLPTTVASGRYNWFTDAQTNRINLPAAAQQKLGFALPPITIREAQFGTVNGTLMLPLDFSGELRHALAAAQAGYRGERARLWATTLEQQTGTLRAYFQLLEAQRLREVTEQTIALDHQQMTTADSRYRAGRVTKNDLLVAQVALRDAEQQLVQRDLVINQARWTLNQTIGADVNAPTVVADLREPPDIPSVDEALRSAQAHNPILLALIEEQQRLDESAQALVRSRLPRFSAGGGIDYSTSAIVQPQSIGSGFTGFTWDLGTDTRREAQIAQAQLAIQENRLAIEGQLRELEAAIRSLHQATAERLSALAAAEPAVGQAEENLRIRQQQFEAGRAQSDDVLIAEALLAQQRATLATALYQAHTRRVELQQLIGAPLEELVDRQR